MFSKLKENRKNMIAMPQLKLKMFDVIDDADSQEIFVGLRSILKGTLPELSDYTIESFVLDLMWSMRPSEKAKMLERWRKEK